MLAEAAIWVAAVTTVVPTAAFALDDICPEFHGKKKGQDILAYYYLAPRDRLPSASLRASSPMDLITLS